MHVACGRRLGSRRAAVALILACVLSLAAMSSQAHVTDTPGDASDAPPSAARPDPTPVAPVGVCPDPSARDLRYTPSSSEHRPLRFVNAAGTALYVRVLAPASAVGGREVLHGVIAEGGSLAVRAAMRSKWLVRTGRGRLLLFVQVTPELPGDLMVTPCRGAPPRPAPTCARVRAVLGLPLVFATCGARHWSPLPCVAASCALRLTFC